MATESPIRMLETGGKWPSSANMAAEDLVLLKGHKFQSGGRDLVPNRSGSAPPSMEGSFSAIESLIMSQQNFNLNTSFGDLDIDTAMQNCETEEQLRADPAYLAYYFSNVNLNPRLPPPHISWENRRLVRHIGSFGSNRKTTSFDDSGNGSLHLSRASLSTHKEEPEDDRSTQQASDDSVDLTLSAGQHKSLVELIQEDFPRTPSPIYNQSHSLNKESSDETVEVDGVSNSLGGYSIAAENAVKSADAAVSLNADHVNAALSSSSISPYSSDTGNEVLAGGVTDADITTNVASKLKALNISMSKQPSPSNARIQEDWKPRHQYNFVQNQARQQQTNVFQVQSTQNQNFSHGISHSSSKFSSEAQPLLQSSGFTPPLFTTAAAYMMASANPFYSSLHPPSPLYSPQYNAGGYAFNPTVLPPFVPGYPPHCTIPLAFDGNNAGPSYGPRTSGVDVQQLTKFYNQPGYGMQPSFNDPLYCQYFQQPFGDGFSGSSQYGPLVSQKVPTVAAGSADQRNGGFTSNLNPRRGANSGPSNMGSQTNMVNLVQFPSSPLATPVLPGSPVGGPSFAGIRTEMRFLPRSGRNVGVYSGWKDQRGIEKFDEPKTYSFLEELKSGKGRRFELSDIAGHVVEFSADQHGSRFIQQKLESCTVEEKASVFNEVLPHASKLITDVFGNYVIQKFFEYGTPEQRKELANQLVGQILPLSLQMYGCRVIQKALEVIELDQKIQLVCELDGHVMRCVRDQNGNHVIQKCIESVPTDKIGFVISAFRGQVATLSTHPYGCRVIQRILEHCTDEAQSQFIVDEILESVCTLAQDQYGNYVTQHVLERGKRNERSQIISKLGGHIVQMSQHKFASNVVEKCLGHGDISERELLIKEIVGRNEGNDNLLIMMKDQFANYVVQKVLETCSDSQREILLGRIRIHLHALKKYTYGKHIAARFEQLFGEEIQTPES